MGLGGALGVIYDNYWVSGNVVNDAYYAAPTEAMAEMLPTLKKQQLQDYTNIILEGDLINLIPSWRTGISSEGKKSHRK